MDFQVDILVILDRIINLIEEKGIKQQAILKEFGYDKSFLSDWRAGKIKNPPIEKIIRFAKYFDVSVDYLLGRTENSQSHKN